MSAINFSRTIELSGTLHIKAGGAPVLVRRVYFGINDPGTPLRVLNADTLEEIAVVGSDEGLHTGVLALALNPAGTILACGMGSAPYIVFIDTATLTENISISITQPSSQVNSLAWSPDGTLLAAASQSSPYIHRWQTSDWSKLSNPGTLPAGVAVQCDFDSTSTYLAVAHTTTPFVTIYNTGTWAKLTNPNTLPAGNGVSCRFSNGGAQLAVGHVNSPYLSIYNNNGPSTQWTLAAAPSPLPSGTTWDIDFSPDGTYAAVRCGTTSPYTIVYFAAGWTAYGSTEMDAAGLGQALRFTPLSAPVLRLMLDTYYEYTLSDFSVITGSGTSPHVIRYQP